MLPPEALYGRRRCLLRLYDEKRNIFCIACDGLSPITGSFYSLRNFTKDFSAFSRKSSQLVIGKERWQPHNRYSLGRLTVVLSSVFRCGYGKIERKTNSLSHFLKKFSSWLSGSRKKPLPIPRKSSQFKSRDGDARSTLTTEYPSARRIRRCHDAGNGRAARPGSEILAEERISAARQKTHDERR